MKAGRSSKGKGPDRLAMAPTRQQQPRNGTPRTVGHRYPSDDEHQVSPLRDKRQKVTGSERPVGQPLFDPAGRTSSNEPGEMHDDHDLEQIDHRGSGDDDEEERNRHVFGG